MEIQNSIFKLDDWSIVEISGSDATNFLQNQLTNSVTNIPISPKGEMAKLQVANKFAAYCSAKGRIIATFWISQPNENCYHLLLSSDIAESLTKKLKMYVLRSKVTIEVQSLLQLYGVTHTTKLDLADQDNYFQYELPSITFDGQIINRKIFATPRDVNISCNSDPAIWNWLEVASGYPRVTLATSEQFVPQMINLESLHAIDFKKGCYPGQEIVARSQYRGTIKRRLQLAQTISHNPIHPGQEIFSSKEPDQPCGLVVLAAKSPGNSDRWILQVECKLEAMNSLMTLENLNGSPLELLPLPYSLLTL
jgi:folate-binding protein YgfZ